jgi:capsular exopolysaccharide synthesis family protein
VVSVLARRKATFAITFLIVMAVGVAVTVTTPKLYSTETSFRAPYSTSPADAAISSGGAQNRPPDELLATQVERLRSEQTLLQALSSAGVKPGPGVVPPRIEVSGLDETSLLRVVVTGGNAEEITRVANVLPNVHLKWLKDKQQERLRKATDTIRTELAKAQTQLATSERALLGYRRGHPVAEVKASHLTLSKEEAETAARLRSVNVDIQTARAQISVIKARLAQEPPMITEETFAGNPRLNRLREQNMALEAQKLDLLREFRPGSDEVSAIESQLAAIQNEMKGQPETVTEKTRVPNPRHAVLSTKLTDLEAALEASQAEDRAVRRYLPSRAQLEDDGKTERWEMEEAALIRDREAAQGVYTMLASRLRALEIGGGTSTFVITDLQRATVPASPVVPQTKRDLAVTVFLALALAFGVVFLFEYLDDRAYSRADVERILPLALLGEVPKIRSLGRSQTALVPVDPSVAEAYRSIRSNIQFEDIDGSIRTLLVTSPSAGDGKTLTAVNLATAMSSSGRKVVLVETDLRRPALGRYFNLTAGPGVTEVVSDPGCLEAALQPTSVPNLWVMSAGKAVEAPAEVLDSGSFTRLLEMLEGRGYHVVLDSPPCLAVADASILAAKVDGVVLVVRVGQTRVAEIANAEEHLRRARARLLGVIYNQVDIRKSYHNGYAYKADPYTQRNSRPPDVTLSEL